MVTDFQNDMESNLTSRIGSLVLDRSEHSLGFILPKHETNHQRNRWEEMKTRLRAFWRSLVFVDYCSAQMIPALRAAAIMVAEWIIWGIGNDTSVMFHIACMYTALSDPNGSLGLRIHYMGMTVVTTVLIGTVLSYYVWDSPIGIACSATAIALATGYSPSLGSPALVQALKLGTVQFTVNFGVFQTVSGYDGVWDPALHALMGGCATLLISILPEIVGNRDAIRCQLSRVWLGFGIGLSKWSAEWGAVRHLVTAPNPNVTIAINKTRAMLEQDTTEDEDAKKWEHSVLEAVNTVHMCCICLSNAFDLTQDCLNVSNRGDVLTMEKEELHELFKAVAVACRRVGLLIQFPWMVRGIPYFRQRLYKAIGDVQTAVAEVRDPLRLEGYGWLPPVVDLIHSELKDVSDKLLDPKMWPPPSPISSLPKRVKSAFPSDFFKARGDPDRVFRAFAFRFAFSFGISTLPYMFIPQSSVSAYWFPMTVALISNPTEAATYQRVAHRTLGTIIGIGLGSLLFPLLQYPGVLTFLMGCNVYVAIALFSANYTIFTMFITGYVFCITVGVGANLAEVVQYRLIWSLAAIFLVTISMYMFPSGSKYVVTEKIIDMTNATKAYAEGVVEHRQLCQDSNVGQSGLDQAVQKVHKLRHVCTNARIAMLMSIHEAVLTPSEGFLVDPHSMAPGLASLVVGASIIPKLVSLVPDIRVDDLLADVDEETTVEMDRLVRRLKSLQETNLDGGRGSGTSSTSTTTYLITTPLGRGPYSHAIALMHLRLNEAGIPYDVQKLLPEEEETT